MRNEPLTCPDCGTVAIPNANEACPSCFRSLVDESSLQERTFNKQIPGAVSALFVFPSEERRRKLNAERQAKRAVWFRRGAGAILIALGAVLGSTSLAIAKGFTLKTIAGSALITLVGGLAVGPLLMLTIYYCLVVGHGRSESRFDFTRTEPSDFLFKWPWWYFRYPVWASPALSAGYDLNADAWSWLNVGFAAMGSLAACFAVSFVHAKEAGRSLYE